eukprot:5231110-Amphidinium_carterae.1
MARSKSSQRAVAHEDKLKQRRDARHPDRHGHDSDDVDLLSPAGTEVASPSQGARTPTGNTSLGTSPKRQSKKSALPRDESVVEDNSTALASKRARSAADGQASAPSASCLSDSAKLDRILQLAEHHTVRLDTQSVALEDLQRRVAALELVPKPPLPAAAPSTSSLPTPPPQCSAMRNPSSLPTPPPQWPPLRTTSSLPTSPAPQGSVMPPRPPMGSRS